jgi:beta-galactosidase
MGERTAGIADTIERRVRLDRSGLILGEERVPLVAASVHYWRLSRAAWRPALEAVRELGVRLVDTYVPWSVHERAQGEYDFGQVEPRLDLTGFLDIVRELGLLAIVRPGPHVNAELTGFGIPHRVLWNEACQARSPAGRPVILPALPLAFPVPSYASRVFFDEATLWLAAVARLLSPQRWPEGPVVLVQIDNEAALYFRDGVYDQDYHPDAVEQYRRFLRSKYGKVAPLRAAQRDESSTFETVTPPTTFAPGEGGPLARHLDWAEFQETMISGALYRFRRILEGNGLEGLPVFHNLPMSEHATPLDPARLEQAVNFVAADYYHRASPGDRRQIARRTTTLVLRAEARSAPAYGAEMAAGLPPFFPPMDAEDNAFNVMTALAYGLRGFNIYMAVGRDRWAGGPIDTTGRSRPGAEFWTRLIAAFERSHFDQLRRAVPVRIIVPRSVRRLMRVAHAFGPLSAAAFHLADDGAERGAFEDPLAPDGPHVVEVERFMRLLQDALDAARIPFGYGSDDQTEASLREAAWTLCVCPGALPRAAVELLARGVMSSRAVSVGPRLPERDDGWNPMAPRIPSPVNARVPLLLPTGASELAEAIEAAARELSLPRLGVEPAAVYSTLHEDAEGRPRVLFAINPDTRDHQARLAAPAAVGARDALTGEPVVRDADRFALRVPARSVRMLELSFG